MLKIERGACRVYSEDERVEVMSSVLHTWMHAGHRPHSAAVSAHILACCAVEFPFKVGTLLQGTGTVRTAL